MNLSATGSKGRFNIPSDSGIHLHILLMSQRDGCNWSNRCLEKETAMPFTKLRARNSSATVPKYVYQQLFYLDDVHLLIIASKLLPQLYFSGALGPFALETAVVNKSPDLTVNVVEIIRNMLR